MSERKRKRAAQSPPRLYREFNDYPVEQVIETARMLYALRPFPLDNTSGLKWHSLVQQAFDFLDNLHKAYAEIAQRRSATDAAYRRAEKRSAELEALPDIVPFERAIREITRTRWIKRAEPKFTAFVVSMPRYFGKNKRQLRALIARWRKNGIPRDDVSELQSLYDIEVRITREQREAKRQAKKRKPSFKGQAQYKPELRAVKREIDAQRNIGSNP